MAFRTGSLVVAFGLVLGCGGSPQAPTSNGATPARRVAIAPLAETVRPEPLQFDIHARKMGSALNLAIVSTGRGRMAAEGFEEPERWEIEVKQAGEALRRTVNGPVSVARSPVGRHSDNRWDVTVKFSVSFLMHTDELPLVVMIAAPNEPPASVTISTL